MTSSCYYLGMNIVAPNSMDRYSLKPQPINTLLFTRVPAAEKASAP